MKNVSRFAAIVALFILPGLQPASGQIKCDSSFRFIESAMAKVAINTVPGHNLNELYDTSGFTWEAWVYLEDTLNQCVLMATEDSVVYQDIFIAMGWGSLYSKLTFLVSTNTGYTTQSIHSSASLMPLQWYHIAAVCDYYAGTMSLYLNGTLTGTGPMPFTAPNRLVRSIYTSLGNFNSQNWHSFNGMLDEVKFWKGVRTPAQIIADSAGCTAPYPPNLIAYFKAKEGAGSFAASTVDTNFTGFNTAHWGANAPVTPCESCCSEMTSPKTNITTPSVSICDTTTDSVIIRVRVTHLTPGTPWTVTLSDGSVVSGIAGTGGDDSATVKVLPLVTTTYTVSASSISSHPCATIAGIMTITIIHCPKNNNYLGIDHLDGSQKCTVYPNPGNGNFTVSVGKSETTRIITIVDVNSHIIKRFEAVGDMYSFDISNVAAGVYNVIVTGSGNVVSKRIIVTK